MYTASYTGICIYTKYMYFWPLFSTITYYSSSGSLAVETIFHGLQFVARPLFYARPKYRTISVGGQVITANSLRSLFKKIQAKLHYYIWFGGMGKGGMNPIFKGLIINVVRNLEESWISKFLLTRRTFFHKPAISSGDR